MTGAAQLFQECHSRGVRLLPDDTGGLMIDAPDGALTPELMERLKTYKPAILAALRGDPGALVRLLDATELWQAALDRVEGDPGFDDNKMAVLRAAHAHWAPTEP